MLSGRGADLTGSSSFFFFFFTIPLFFDGIDSIVSDYSPSSSGAHYARPRRTSGDDNCQVEADALISEQRRGVFW